jgi:hypothetical protein
VPRSCQPADSTLDSAATRGPPVGRPQGRQDNRAGGEGVSSRRYHRWRAAATVPALSARSGRLAKQEGVHVLDPMNTLGADLVT